MFSLVSVNWYAYVTLGSIYGSYVVVCSFSHLNVLFYGEALDYIY